MRRDRGRERIEGEIVIKPSSGSFLSRTNLVAATSGPVFVYDLNTGYLTSWTGGGPDPDLSGELNLATTVL